MVPRTDALLRRWIKKLQTHLDLDALMEECCRVLLKLTGADRCSIMVLDLHAEELTVRWAQGMKVKPYGRAKFRVGEGLCGWAARSQKPLFSLEMNKELRFVPSPTARRRFRPVKALCCIPLVVEGQTVAVMNLSSFNSNKEFRYCVRQRLPKPFLEELAQVIAQATLLREAQAVSQRWRRLAKAASEMVAQVSHEVRTPLALMTEGTQQLLDGLEGELTPRHRERLLFIKAQTDRMLKLVTEILDLSRIEAGRFSLSRRAVDLAQVIREVKAGVAPLISPRRLIAEIGAVPPVYGDKNRLAQVVENLLTNAVKFTPPDGAITLSAALRGRCAEFSVSDTGIGMTPRERRRLFEKFFQTRVPAGFNSKGIGLGLVIVREIVHLHGGAIRVSSEPGQGTRFTVSIPLYTPSFALSEEFRVMREQAAREGMVLAVQFLQLESSSLVNWEEMTGLFQRHLSRQDRVLVHPGGGLIILSVSDREGFRAIRARLEEVLKSTAAPAAGSEFRWGCVIVPEEETELNKVLELVQRKTQKRGASFAQPARGPRMQGVE